MKKQLIKKHLHGRGEDTFNLKTTILARETPPRTWRRRSTRTLTRVYAGNTSTDVEKTDADRPTHRLDRKHLHGRGEDCAVKRQGRNGPGETPPRTWRRPRQCSCEPASSGNTSTDVEKTKTSTPTRRPSRKHLHGRGEDLTSTKPIRSSPETPPRTWRRLGAVQKARIKVGNTSTDVEKT